MTPEELFECTPPILDGGIVALTMFHRYMSRDRLRLQFRYALTNEQCMDLIVTHASTITVGEICELLYRCAPRSIPPEAGIQVLGSRTFKCLSRAPHRFVWRPARNRRHQRLWPGIPVHGRRRVSLARHCLKVVRRP
ncbi:cbhB [Symbiodinium sp. CCMP2592]|nr:cbhB [Symbiodinium sp. CCMP2592]